jgi:hypothetical protein
MVDGVSLSIALGAIVVSILTHIKTSKCGKNCEFSTKTPPETRENTPISDYIKNNSINNTMKK